MIPTDVTTLNSHEAASSAAFLSDLVEDIFFYDFQLSAESSLAALHERKYYNWKVKSYVQYLCSRKKKRKIN
jgi:hypothetical protein